MGQGEADYIEVVAFDARDEAAGLALDGVGAGFVARLAGCEVTRDFARGERSEMDFGGFDEGAALGAGEAEEGDAGDDGVRAPGEGFEHVAGVVCRARLAEDAAVEGDEGVGGEDDGWAQGVRGDAFGFSVGEAFDESDWRFTRASSFVDGRRGNLEPETGVAENFGAAGR